jgi:hypothetical protein
MQLPAPGPHPMATRLPAPGRAPLDCAAPGRPRRAACPMGLARTVGAPAQRKAEAGNAGAAPGLLATTRDDPRLGRCPFQPTLAPPWPQLSRAVLGVGRIVQRGHVSSRVAAPTRLATPAGLAPLLTPPVEGLGPIHGGPDRRDDAAWRGPHRRRPDLAVGLPHACRQPFPHQPPPRTSLQAFLPQPDPPVVRDGVNAPCAVRFSHAVLPPNRERDRQLIPRVHGPHLGPRPIAPAQEARRVDGVAAPPDRAWPQLILHGRAPERAAWAVALRDVVPRAAFGSGALPRPCPLRSALPSPSPRSCADAAAVLGGPFCRVRLPDVWRPVTVGGNV